MSAGISGALPAAVAVLGDGSDVNVAGADGEGDESSVLLHAAHDMSTAAAQAVTSAVNNVRRCTQSR